MKLFIAFFLAVVAIALTGAQESDDENEGEAPWMNNGNGPVYTPPSAFEYGNAPWARHGQLAQQQFRNNAGFRQQWRNSRNLAQEQLDDDEAGVPLVGF